MCDSSIWTETCLRRLFIGIVQRLLCQSLIRSLDTETIVIIIIIILCYYHYHWCQNVSTKLFSGQMGELCQLTM